MNISWIEVKQGGFGDHKVDGPSRLNVGTLEKCVGGLKGMKVNAS